MDLITERMDVWAAGIKNEPGGLANVLRELREVGADLEFIIARRTHEEPDAAVVFLSPLRGDAEISAAATLGFNVTTSVQCVRVEGDNEPGIVATLTEKLAAAGINLRGLSAAVFGTRFMLYIGFDSAEDAEKAIDVLQSA